MGNQTSSRLMRIPLNNDAKSVITYGNNRNNNVKDISFEKRILYLLTSDMYSPELFINWNEYKPFKPLAQKQFVECLKQIPLDYNNPSTVSFYNLPLDILGIISEYSESRLSHAVINADSQLFDVNRRSYVCSILNNNSNANVNLTSVCYLPFDKIVFTTASDNNNPSKIHVVKFQDALCDPLCTIECANTNKKNETDNKSKHNYCEFQACVNLINNEFAVICSCGLLSIYLVETSINHILQVNRVRSFEIGEIGKEYKKLNTDTLYTTLKVLNYNQISIMFNTGNTAKHFIIDFTSETPKLISRKCIRLRNHLEIAFPMIDYNNESKHNNDIKSNNHSNDSNGLLKPIKLLIQTGSGRIRSEFCDLSNFDDDQLFNSYNSKSVKPYGFAITQTFDCVFNINNEGDFLLFNSAANFHCYNTEGRLLNGPIQLAGLSRLTSVVQTCSGSLVVASSTNPSDLYIYNDYKQADKFQLLNKTRLNCYLLNENGNRELTAQRYASRVNKALYPQYSNNHYMW